MPAAPPLCRAPLCRGAAAAPLACKLPTCACPLAAQRRGMFIQTQPTPNPASLMFIPGQKVLEGGSKSFTSAREAMASPLAKKLFAIDGVTQVGRPACEYVPCVCVCGQARGPTPMHPTICAGAHRPQARATRPALCTRHSLPTPHPRHNPQVFFGSDFVTVTKSEDYGWAVLKPDVFAAIMDHYSSGEALFYDEQVCVCVVCVVCVCALASPGGSLRPQRAQRRRPAQPCPALVHPFALSAGHGRCRAHDPRRRRRGGWLARWPGWQGGRGSTPRGSDAARRHNKPHPHQPRTRPALPLPHARRWWP